MNQYNITVMQAGDGAATPNILWVASCFLPAGGLVSTYGETIGEALSIIAGKIETAQT